MSIKGSAIIHASASNCDFICIHAEGKDGEVFSICEYDVDSRSQLTNQINFVLNLDLNREKLVQMFKHLQSLTQFKLQVGAFLYESEQDENPSLRFYEVVISFYGADLRPSLKESLFFVGGEIQEGVHTKIADWFLARLNQDHPQEK